MFLGHTLQRQKKYQEQVWPYERALSFEKSPNALTLTERRVVTDHLVYAYYSIGKSQKAEALLQAAIKRDPDYPLY
jgi:tetratricopeptide (TPR) repeat protein